MNKAVFFDRDGVINHDYGYVHDFANFTFIDGVVESLAKLRTAGFLLVLITNQSGIARGMYTEDDFWRLTDEMQDYLQVFNAPFDAVFCCPHLKDGKVKEYAIDCDCRKPKPGMFLNAIENLDIDPDKSIMIGDHASDLIAAKDAKIRTLVLVGEHVLQEKERIDNILCYKDVKDFVDNYLR